MTNDPFISNRNPVYVRNDHVGLTVSDVTVVQPEGKTSTRPVIEYRGAPSGVVCVITAGDKVLLGNQWRAAINDWSLAMPRGMAGVGELALDAARRECVEETGYMAETAKHIGFLYADTGLLSTPIFAVHIHPDLQNRQTRDDEFASLRWVQMSDMDHLIRSCQISDAITITAWTKFQTLHPR